jgi:hypothetical protein
VPKEILMGDDPLVLTPFNITVIRFTQEGMLEKVNEVPDVVF